MKKILIISALILFSCTQQKQNFSVLPEKAAQQTKKDSVFVIEDSEFYKRDIDKSFVETDTSAKIRIISQIPFESFNLYLEADLVDLNIRQSSPRTLLVELPQNFFFNSIQAASEISDFARTNPASVRGIFGNLMGITELAKGTQKVIFGIIPRNAKALEFRFETAVSDTAQILNSLIWKYNSRFNISLSENKISMDRRTNVFDGAKQISLENIAQNDPVRMLGEDKNLSALLFKRSDFALVRSDLQDFRVASFDNFKVSAFFNPLLDDEARNLLTNLLETADYGKKLDYNLRVFNSGNPTADFTDLDKDSVVIIYAANNLIAFETAMALRQFLEEKTGKKIAATADFGQRKLYFSDYDIAITANSVDLDERFLSRKYSMGIIPSLRTDLFEMKIYLVSSQNIVSSGNRISKLELAK